MDTFKVLNPDKLEIPCKNPYNESKQRINEMRAQIVKLSNAGEEVMEDEFVIDEDRAMDMYVDYILNDPEMDDYVKEEYAAYASGEDERGREKRVGWLVKNGKISETSLNGKYSLYLYTIDEDDREIDEYYTESDDYDEEAWDKAYDLLDKFRHEEMGKTSGILVDLEFDNYREVLKMTYDKKRVYVASEYGCDGGYWANAEEGDLEQDLKNIQRYFSENGIELIVAGKDIQLAFSEALKKEHERNNDEPWINPTFDIRCKVQMKEKYLTESGNNVEMRLKGFVSAWDSKNKPGMVDIVCKCPWCKRTNVITMNKTEWYDGVLAVNDGELIQDAFPTLGDDEREMLKTGICDPCWKSLRGDEDEEY